MAPASSCPRPFGPASLPLGVYPKGIVKHECSDLPADLFIAALSVMVSGADSLSCVRSGALVTWRRGSHSAEYGVVTGDEAVWGCLLAWKDVHFQLIDDKSMLGV